MTSLSDPTTFVLSFLAVFGGLAAYLVWLDRQALRLEKRLERLEETTATAKNDGETRRDQG